MHITAEMKDGPLAGRHWSFECLNAPEILHVTSDGILTRASALEIEPKRALTKVCVYQATQVFGSYSFVSEYNL